ncbi:amidophosphoribosyltransferase [Mucisphaera calidilacus]|uniref:amidophosphoribosyltransferase n=1 Tax=Mucisphaera calidilacus TaxID=2527982 RepID=UPI0011A72DC7
MCGIAGIVAQADVCRDLYDALTVLQHRGQDAAGIVTCDQGSLKLRKGNGLVRDVFDQATMDALTGNMGIAHCRYPTAGSCSGSEAQPFYVNSPYGITLAHNGNLTNTEALTRELFRSDLRHINTGSDSEALLNVFAHELGVIRKLRPEATDVFQAVRRLHRRCRGAYAFVAMIAGYGLIGVRDPYGIRPLVIGRRESLIGNEYILASESVALDTLGFELVRDVAPGEAVFITSDGALHSELCAEASRLCPCIFEHVYLARPDSILDGISVYKSRLRMGERLAAKLTRLGITDQFDVAIPIPDTSRTSALQLATDLGIKYREGFIKNRYIGRTFIMPGQQQRAKSVRQKLNPIGLEFKGKNVLLVDDSIVRGTTCKQIIQMAREAGAHKVFYCSAAPAIRYPNVYGIDMPSAHELIAHGRTDAEVAESIGADWLVYQDLEDLVASAAEGNPHVERFECSVFDGHYVTGDVDEPYLDKLQQLRNDQAKQLREGTVAAGDSLANLGSS